MPEITNTNGNLSVAQAFAGRLQASTLGLHTTFVEILQNINNEQKEIKSGVDRLAKQLNRVESQLAELETNSEASVSVPTSRHLYIAEMVSGRNLTAPAKDEEDEISQSTQNQASIQQTLSSVSTTAMPLVGRLRREGAGQRKSIGEGMLYPGSRSEFTRLIRKGAASDQNGIQQRGKTSATKIASQLDTNASPVRSAPPCGPTGTAMNMGKRDLQNEMSAEPAPKRQRLRDSNSQ